MNPDGLGAVRTAAASAAVTARSVSLLEDLESRLLLSGTAKTVWQIGNGRNLAGSNQITLRQHPGRPWRVQALVGGTALDSRLIRTLRGVRIDAGPGNDVVRLALGNASTLPVTVLGNSGNDRIVGSVAADVIDGGAGDDSIEGGLGADWLYGGEGNDLVEGDEGSHRIWGGLGRDTLVGGLDRDRIQGDAGDDRISGGWGSDILEGESGRDTIYGGVGNDTLDGGSGRDELWRRANDKLVLDELDRLKREIQGNPLAEVTDREAYRARLIEAAVQQWKYLFGQKVYYHNYETRLAADGPAAGEVAVLTFASASAASDAAALGASALTASSTNTQEAGVDEADLVETDGQYIYLARRDHLVIVDATPAAEMREVARISTGGSIRGIYLTGDRVTVVSTDGLGAPVEGRLALPANLAHQPTEWRPTTRITVVDVGDRTAPAIREETVLAGQHAATRMIGTKLYAVVNSTIEVLRPQIVDRGGDAHDGYETEAEFRARLEAVPLEEMLPGYVSRLTGEDVIAGSLGGGDLYAPAVDVVAGNLFSVVMLDVSDDDPDPDAVTAAAGYGGAIYASADSIYVASESWETPIGRWPGDVRTELVKFDLTGGGVELAGQGAVPGHVVDQFAMSERGEDLRIATTTRLNGTSNNVFVLRDSGDVLEPVGALTGLALTEQIYAARFVGDRAYLVTFRQLDPFFTIDLSDPEAPRVEGELKVPGFSTYLHPIDEDRVVGIGRVDNLFQVSLFDVSDMANPTRSGHVVFQAWSNSAAERDHHAFAWYPEQGILAIPVSGDVSDLAKPGHPGFARRLELIRVNDDGSLELVGNVPHAHDVQRSLSIGETLYSIGGDAIKAVAFDDPATVIGSVSFLPDGPGGEGDPPYAVIEWINGSGGWAVAPVFAFRFQAGEPN